MKKFKLNLSVMNLNEGGLFWIDEWENIDSNYRCMFYEELEEGLESVSIEEGFKDLDEYFGVGDEDREDDVEKYEELKKEFINKIGDRKGKFYVWGVEYDCELTFVED